MFIQLSMFVGEVGINLLPTPTEVVALGPAPQWCGDCYEVRPIQWDSNIDEWVCDHYLPCSDCGWLSENHCGECECCDDCCTCRYCEECGEMVSSDDSCSNCNLCDSHCDCFTCPHCERVYRSPEDAYACSNCEQCERCCGGCGEDYSEEYEDGCSCDSCNPQRSVCIDVPTDGRYIGIEVEFGGSMEKARHALAAAGLRGWEIKYDGSVSTGGEMTSPPLNWDDDNAREELFVALNALQSAGCEPIPAAGVHVHVNARDLSPKQRAAVAVWAFDYEDIFIRLASSGWQTLRSGARTYAKKIGESYAARLARVETLTDLNSEMYSQGRYLVVNLQAFSDHGTVEFRAFNSSTSPARIAAYAAVCMAVVQAVRDGKPPKPATRYALGEMAAGTNTSLHCRTVLLSTLGPWLTPTDVHRICEAWEDSHAQLSNVA